MKTTIITFLSIVTFAFGQTPTTVQLQLDSSQSTQRQIFTPLKPIILSPDQVATMTSVVAGMGLLSMPDGYGLADLRSISISPITSGSNAGSVMLVISVTSH